MSDKVQLIRDSINHLMWTDIDGFFKELSLIAQEEQQRKVISAPLKEWWNSLETVLNKFPYENLPKDD